MLGRKPRALEDVHGTQTGYKLRGCRCEACCNWKKFDNAQTRRGMPTSGKQQAFGCPRCLSKFANEPDYKAHYKQTHTGRN
jgi:hypothetical protein